MSITELKIFTGIFFLLTTSELTISYTAPDDTDTQIEKYWGNC